MIEMLGELLRALKEHFITAVIVSIVTAAITWTVAINVSVVKRELEVCLSEKTKLQTQLETCNRERDGCFSEKKNLQTQLETCKTEVGKSCVSATCESVEIGQLFVSRGKEAGKGNMLVVKEGGDVVKTVSLREGCKSTKLTYSFKVARYANTKLEIALVKFSVKLADGNSPKVSEKQIENHTTDYSDVGKVLQDITGEVSWRGTPTTLELFVNPGDWGLEIRELKIEFK